MSRRDAVLAAEVEHLLRLADAADERARRCWRRLKIRLKTAGDGCGFAGAPDQAQRAVALEQRRCSALRSCGAETVSRMKSKLPACALHRVGVRRDHDLVGAEPPRVGGLARRGREQHDVGAERVRELHAHVAEPAEADDADLLAAGHAPVAQRRVGGDARAQQRRGAGGVEVGRDAQHELLVHDDALRVAAVGHRRRCACRGCCRSRIGPLWQNCSRPSRQFGQVRQESTRQPTAARSPALNFVTLGADAADPADDLVARDTGIDRALPLVAGGVQVGVADAAVQDVDLDVARQRLAAVEGE